MIVLGINDGHNASAALIKDGLVLACASEERFSRLKNDEGYPRRAIEFVLESTGSKPQDCDYIANSTLYLSPINLKIKRTTLFTIKDYIREMHEYWKPVLLEKKTSDFWDRIQSEERFRNLAKSSYNFVFLKNTPKEKWEEVFQLERKRVAAEHLRIPEDKIIFVDHHTCHAYYAYFASQIDRSKRIAVVTADSWGDGCNATISVAQDGTIKEIHRTNMCHLARIYRWMTLLLAFKPMEHEYKVMGLAPYAKDYIRKPAYEIFKELLVVDGIDFKWNKEPSDMYFYFKDRFEKEAVRFDGVAGGLQQWLEEILSEWIKNVLMFLKTDLLVYSGGLSMNVKANKILAGLSEVKNFFVPPSGGDESLSMGAAFFIASKKDNIKPLSDVYLGSAPDLEETEEVLKKYSTTNKFKIVRNPLPDYIADILADGNVIGRCVGRMEFGARALGNRSILCDPSKWQNVRRINEKIKFRDFWMPFTPSILEERASDYIVNPKKLKAPFMTVAFDTTQLAREHFKAAVHPYDFSIRPQILNEEVNPEYFAIIKAFEKKTGIGGMLNTSLNLHGMPIVRTSSDAMHAFVNSGLDAILLPGILVLKN